jgi:chloramphenicol-sensitive protein RarD
VVPVDPRTSLSAETLLVAPLAMGFLAFSHTVDHHGQFSLMTAQFVLLASSGLSTAAPLLLFYADAIRHRRKALRLRERKFAT